MTEKTYETIISVLINSKIEAENNNKNGINNVYIKSIDDALEELKVMKMKQNNQRGNMVLVRCISERSSRPDQIVVGKKYWIDTSTIRKDCDGDEYAQVYLDEAKEKTIGNMLTSHFVLHSID